MGQDTATAQSAKSRLQHDVKIGNTQLSFELPKTLMAKRNSHEMDSTPYLVTPNKPTKSIV
jgi:hypothetical protein